MTNQRTIPQTPNEILSKKTSFENWLAIQESLEKINDFATKLAYLIATENELQKIIDLYYKSNYDPETVDSTVQAHLDINRIPEKTKITEAEFKKLCKSNGFDIKMTAYDDLISFRQMIIAAEYDLKNERLSEHKSQPVSEIDSANKGMELVKSIFTLLPFFFISYFCFWAGYNFWQCESSMDLSQEVSKFRALVDSVNRFERDGDNNVKKKESWSERYHRTVGATLKSKIPARYDLSHYNSLFDHPDNQFIKIDTAASLSNQKKQLQYMRQRAYRIDSFFDGGIDSINSWLRIQDTTEHISITLHLSDINSSPPISKLRVVVENNSEKEFTVNCSLKLDTIFSFSEGAFEKEFKLMTSLWNRIMGSSPEVARNWAFDLSSTTMKPLDPAGLNISGKVLAFIASFTFFLLVILVPLYLNVLISFLKSFKWFIQLCLFLWAMLLVGSYFCFYLPLDKILHYHFIGVLTVWLFLVLIICYNIKNLIYRLRSFETMKIGNGLLPLNERK